jgi:squalene-hopene/tetraprenyl-beta-curcumene cyclase
MGDRSAYQEQIDAAVEYILSCVHPYSGAIYRSPSEERKGGGLPNYNTAICMVALHAVGDPKLVPVVQKARKYMAASQRLGDGLFSGGMGYDPDTGRDYTDLSNSYLGFEAMRLTENVEDLRQDGEERVDLDWEAARKFIQRCQNDPRFNDRPWANPDPDERGGFAYHPDQTRAGTVTDAEGILRFRSMPGMSYAGLLSYIYADVDRADPRVQATINWAINHWSLETATRDPEKAGTDAALEGLFYLFNVMSKGLAAYGQDVFKPADGAAFNWRVEMIEKLVGLQKFDDDGNGYWVNEVSRYWEGDKVLTTAYSLIALQLALGNN